MTASFVVINSSQDSPDSPKVRIGQKGARQIVLDTETTGLSVRDGHRLIEVGCIELIARRRTGNDLHMRINPERSVPSEAVTIHGISDYDLENMPKFFEISAQLREYLDGAELIIHNAAFDLEFLDFEFKLAGYSEPLSSICQVVDTWALASKMHPGRGNSLDALCRRYSIDLTSRKSHGAMIDSELLARVYLLMTAGQGALSLAEENTINPSPSSRLIEAFGGSDQKPLLVIRATSEEIEAHEARMAQIRISHKKTLEEKARQAVVVNTGKAQGDKSNN